MRSFYTFPNGVRPKVNVIARLEFKLACYNFAVHRVNHYTTKKPNVNEVCSLNVKTVLFQAIQFSINIQFTSILPIKCYHTGPESDGYEEVLRIPQSSSLSSDSLVSYPGHSLLVGVLPLCRGAVGIFYSPSRLDNYV